MVGHNSGATFGSLADRPRPWPTDRFEVDVRAGTDPHRGNTRRHTLTACPDRDALRDAAISASSCTSCLPRPGFTTNADIDLLAIPVHQQGGFAGKRAAERFSSLRPAKKRSHAVPKYAIHKSDLFWRRPEPPSPTNGSELSGHDRHFGPEFRQGAPTGTSARMATSEQWLSEIRDYPSQGQILSPEKYRPAPIRPDQASPRLTLMPVPISTFAT